MASILARALLPNALEMVSGQGIGGKKFGKYLINNPLVQGMAYNLGARAVDNILGEGVRKRGKTYKLSHGLGISPGIVPPPTPFGGMIGKLYTPPKINYTPPNMRGKPAPALPSAPPAPSAPASIPTSALKPIAPLAPHLRPTASIKSRISGAQNKMINKLPTKMSSLYPMAKSTFKKATKSVKPAINKIISKTNSLGTNLKNVDSKIAKKTGSLLTKASRTMREPKKVLKKIGKKVKRAGQKLGPKIKVGLQKLKQTGKKYLKKGKAYLNKGRSELNKRIKNGSGMNPVIPGPLP